MSDPILNSNFLSLVTAEETREIVIKNSVAGHDEIRASTLKSISLYIVDPLACVCNLSINQCLLAFELKISNILPKCKAVDPFCSTIIDLPCVLTECVITSL